MGKTTEIKKYKSPCGREINFPVAKIKGINDGPKVLIIAGVHGCEYPSIVAAIRFSQELKPEEISGEVTIIPVCSTLAFEKRTVFVNPIDGKNPNRVVPGNLTGTYSDALTYYLYQDFIAKADYFLDLHGGDMVEALEPFSIYHEGENKETARLSREIAEYFLLPNVLHTVPGASWDDSGTTYGNAARAGIPSAILEVGGIGQLDQPSVDKHLIGLRNVLRHFKVLKGEAVKPQNVQHYNDFVWLRSPAAGIFYRAVEVGDTLKKGQKIGHVEDYFGNILAEMNSTHDGKVMFLTSSPAMADQGLILGMGV